MTTALNNRTLASIVAEFFSEDETKSVVFCDAGEAGRVVDYVPATMANLIMTDIPEGDDRTSDDGFESFTQSEWQEGENGYRWQVRF